LILSALCAAISKTIGVIVSKTENLFKEIVCPCTSPRDVLGFLGQYGICNLAYTGEAGRNPGYIFRGELSFPFPLRSSLERNWLENNQGKTLLHYEKRVATDFVRTPSGIIDRATEHGHPIGKKSEEEVFWWLSLMQHYRRGTRLLDFTRDIRFALFFALEAYSQKVNEDHRENGLLIYCFPCKDLRWPNDDEINKSPFRHRIKGQSSR
jgi:FRG domain